MTTDDYCGARTRCIYTRRARGFATGRRKTRRRLPRLRYTIGGVGHGREVQCLYGIVCAAPLPRSTRKRERSYEIGDVIWSFDEERKCRQTMFIWSRLFTFREISSSLSSSGKNHFRVASVYARVTRFFTGRRCFRFF